MTLVEVLIAMLLGLVLMSAILAMVLSTSRANETLAALSRLQESGRLALFMLERDIRMAGYRGCAYGEIRTLLDDAGPGYRDELYDFNQPFFGYVETAVAGIPTGLLGADFDALYARGDVLIVKNAAMPMGLTLGADIEPDDTGVDLDAAINVPIGRLVMITDCNGGGDLFQVTTDDPSPSVKLERNRRYGTIGPGNLNPAAESFSRFYDDVETELMRADANVYYVGFQRNDDGTAATATSLRRVRMGERAGADPVEEELLDGVYDLRVQFGIDDSDNGMADRYETPDAMASADWELVVALRLGVLVYSGERLTLNPADEAYSVPFDETLWSFPVGEWIADPDGEAGEQRFLAPDGQLYRFFSTTVAVRNRVL